MNGKPWLPYAVIGAISATLVLFEVLVTRVLSVALAYHFAFMAISLAMLGLGAPGVWFAVLAPKPRSLLWSLLASAALLPASMLAIVWLGAPLRGATMFWVLCVLGPLVALGSGICLLLLSAEGVRIGKMYAADLVGAALGAVLVVPLLHGLPTPMVIAALGFVPLLAAGALFPEAKLWLGLGALILGASLFWPQAYQLRYNSYYVEEVPPLYEKWTPTARLTILDPSSHQFAFGGWGIGKPGLTMSPHYWLDQDGGAGTQILRYRRGNEYPPELLFDVTSAAFQLAKPNQACIIGGGGGRDILTALAAGSARVEVVELNPYTIDAISHRFGSYTGDPYHMPQVTTFAGEGRSHFMRSHTRCDVLQISLIDTFTATAAGAYALTENGLYTVEALQTFWQRLSAHGVLSITRWSAGPGQMQAVRLAFTALEALRREGIAQPRQHLAVMGAGLMANVMLFRDAVDAARLSQLARVAQARSFSPIWPVGRSRRPPSLVTIGLQQGEAPFRAMGFDLSPATDDRPFFFQQMGIFSTHSGPAQANGPDLQSVALIRRLLAIVSALSLLLFFVPLAWRGRLSRRNALGRSTTFFAAIGVGFMLVEVPLVQRLALYLGHPSYSTTIVLGALLLGTGLGAALASSIPEHRMRVALLCAPVAILSLLIPLIGPIATITLAWQFAARASIAALIVFLAGVALGLPFSLGMSLFDHHDRSWYWAINGAAGVLASILALALSMAFGFSVVIPLAVVCYLVAFLAFPQPTAAS